MNSKQKTTPHPPKKHNISLRHFAFFVLLIKDMKADFVVFLWLLMDIAGNESGHRMLQRSRAQGHTLTIGKQVCT